MPTNFFKDTKFSYALELIRFQNPFGTFLLFLPCAMGLAIQNAAMWQYALFFIGSFFMRSFGCCVNDFFDKDFDKHVARTKNRPIACGKLTPKEGLVIALIMLAGGGAVFLTLPTTSQWVALIGLGFAIIYPLMKRITFWPQAFLGLTFNMGALVTCYDFQLIYLHIILYASCFFWTLAYDSIYGFQDIQDDQIIGVKSSSQVIAKYPKLWMFMFYALQVSFFSCILANHRLIYLCSAMVFIGGMLYFWQPKNVERCKILFRINVLYGFLHLLVLFSG